MRSGDFMFVVAVEFVVDEAHVESFRKEVLLQAKNSLKLEEACHVFDVCFDPECPTDCFLYEVYDDRAAFDRHRETGHFANFNATITPWVVSKDVRFLERFSLE